MGNKKGIDLSKNAKALGVSKNKPSSGIVVVTGYAELTPLGDTRETEKAERVGKSGAKKYPTGNFRSNLAAPADFHPEDHFSVKELQSLSRIGAMGVVLAKEAGKMANVLDENGKIRKDLIDPRRAGCTVSSGIGSSTETVNIYNKLHWKKNPDNGELEPIAPEEGSRFMSPFAGLVLFPEELGGNIEAYLGLQGWGNNSSEACSTGLSSIADGYQLIKSGKNDIVFAGGIEDTLTLFPEVSIGVFAAMRGPLSSRNDEPEIASRPFDKERDGFVLGAGGGVVVLESLESAQKRKAPIYAVILNAEKGSDGTNPTNLNEERVAALVVKTLKQEKGQLYWPVDAIFAHATSTKSGDVAEISALKLALGDEYLQSIPITAIKSMHGHLAGGAGAINMISGIRAIEKGFIPPIINLKEPDEPFKGLNLVRGKSLKGTFNTALVLAYGFHGKDSAVLIGKFEN